MYNTNGSPNQSASTFPDSASRYTQNQEQVEAGVPTSQPQVEVADASCSSNLSHKNNGQLFMQSGFPSMIPGHVAGGGPRGSDTSPLSNSPSNVTDHHSMNKLPSNKHNSSSDREHPSVNGTPEDFPFPHIQYSRSELTRINPYELREEMVNVWTLLSDRALKRGINIEGDGIYWCAAKYETDVVSDGTISLETAEHRLHLYKNVLMKLYPIIVVDKDLSLEELRKNHPTKFVTIMSTASLLLNDVNYQNECIILLNRAYQSVIYDVMLVGSKTFELLECLILLICWYNEPAFYHQLKCNMLTYLMVSMASDLGLAGMSIGMNSASLKYERIIRPQVLVDANSVECRKLWLFVYCCTAGFTNFTRKSAFSLWSKYTEECCEIVEASHLPLDERRVVFFAKLARILEEISTSLYSTGSNPPSILDPKVAYLVLFFEEKLNSLYESVKRHTDIYEPFFHAVQVYLHQMVLYVPYDDSLGRSPFSEYSLAIGRFICSSESINCLSWCLSSSLRCIELFHGQLDEGLASLPFFAYSRYVFCVSMVLKVHTLVLLTPGLQKIFPLSPDHISIVCEISTRLDSISRKFTFSNATLSFSFIIKLLLLFFDRQVQRRLNGKEAKIPDLDIPKKQPTFLDPNDCVNRFSKSSNQYRGESLPGSPLDILSSVAVDSRRQSQVNIDSDKVKKLDKLSDNKSEEEEYPSWLMNDDFWKDMIPNIEAFTGYDVL